MTVRGSVDSFLSGCHGTCAPADNVFTDLHMKYCEPARRFCQGGRSTSRVIVAA